MTGHQVATKWPFFWPCGHFLVLRVMLMLLVTRIVAKKVATWCHTYCGLFLGIATKSGNWPFFVKFIN